MRRAAAGPEPPPPLWFWREPGGGEHIDEELRGTGRMGLASIYAIFFFSATIYVLVISLECFPTAGDSGPSEQWPLGRGEETPQSHRQKTNRALIQWMGENSLHTKVSFFKQEG